MSDPIERTTRYTTIVDDLPTAWRFVMAYLDEVGPAPHIEIRPISQVSVPEMLDGLNGAEQPDWKRRFEVVVDGTVRVEVQKEAQR